MNHDGTSGTVDLFSKYVLFSAAAFDEGSDYTVAWNASDLRCKIISNYDSVLNGFSQDIQNTLADRAMYDSFTGWVNEKICIPSINEVGCNISFNNGNNWFYSHIGTIYPLFGNSQQTSDNRSNPLAIRKYTDGITRTYWTCQNSDGSSMIAVSGNGSATSCTVYVSDAANGYEWSKNSAIAIIRFSKR